MISLVCISVGIYYMRFVGSIADMSASPNGELLATVAEDKALKVFDIVNFGKFYCILRG